MRNARGFKKKTSPAQELALAKSFAVLDHAFAQLSLQDLSGAGLGQTLQEFDVLGAFIARQAGTA
jgi:hypothetical protein